jgi:mannosidase alpha-like ER degradation enhancer 2
MRHWLTLCFILVWRDSDSVSAQRPIIPENFYTQEHLSELRAEVKELFYHAYNGYLNYAYPLDELQPLTCRGVDTWGSYSLTLIDALSTLAVLGNHTEFRRVVNVLSKKSFDSDINVSVFETNIRIVGGKSIKRFTLLSCHNILHYLLL